MSYDGAATTSHSSPCGCGPARIGGAVRTRNPRVNGRAMSTALMAPPVTMSASIAAQREAAAATGELCSAIADLPSASTVGIGHGEPP